MEGGYTYEQLSTAVLVILGFIAAFNLVVSGVKSYKEMKSGAPVTKIQAQIDQHQQMLASDKRRIEALEAKTNDLHDGLMATCFGVQVLIDHELHNGNAEDMQDASKEISKWLRARK